MRHGLDEHGLTSSGRTVQQDALGRGSQTCVEVGPEQRQYGRLLQGALGILQSRNVRPLDTDARTIDVQIVLDGFDEGIVGVVQIAPLATLGTGISVGGPCCSFRRRSASSRSRGCRSMRMPGRGPPAGRLGSVLLLPSAGILLFRCRLPMVGGTRWRSLLRWWWRALPTRQGRREVARDSGGRIFIILILPFVVAPTSCFLLRLLLLPVQLALDPFGVAQRHPAPFRHGLAV
mmetsp:Transcript_31257/g.91551  ORF Transcript_31257/g.91551 Transcript_31257/m.91551 type:complete len:233 (-) Transcript_31257:154-852(-)